jgi:hypothetical protein
MKFTTAIILAATLALPASAGPLADILAEAEAACAGFESGIFDPADAVTEIDLTGDGLPDTLIDESKFTCTTAASMYCGSGGCMLHAIVGDTETTWQSLGWKTLNWGPDTILLVGRDGGWCGGAGSQHCYEALNWSQGAFRSVMPPVSE